MSILIILGIGFLIGTSIAYAINKLCIDSYHNNLAIEPNYIITENLANNNLEDENVIINNYFHNIANNDEVPPKYEDI